MSLARVWARVLLGVRCATTDPSNARQPVAQAVLPLPHCHRFRKRGAEVFRSVHRVPEDAAWCAMPLLS